MVKEISTQDFKKEVIDADKPVLVDFYADWCGPCKMIAPMIDELSKEITKINFVKLNVDKSPEIPTQYGIMGIPTLILFKKNQELMRITGVRPKDILKKQIEDVI
ncbi:thioredoxin [archaeon]|nr:thioredoxin [archaeon]